MRHCLAEADIDALAAAAHGFVGADLAAICDEAAMAALRRVIASRQAPPAAPQQTQMALQSSNKPNSRGDKHVSTDGHAKPADVYLDMQQDQQQVVPDSDPPAEQLQPAALTSDSTQHRKSLPTCADSNQLRSHSQPADNNTPQNQAWGHIRVCTNAEDSSNERLEGHSARTNIKSAMQSSSARAESAELQITLADFKVAETRVRPSAMREVALEVTSCPFCLLLSLNMTIADTIAGITVLSNNQKQKLEQIQNNSVA